MTMITPSYLGETIEYSSLHACRSTLEDPTHGYDAADVKRIALNWDQVQQYDPPPNPAKLTDSRAAGYVDRFGDESWELDALEPQVISDLIQDTIDDIKDQGAWDEATEEQEVGRRYISRIVEHWDNVKDYLNDVWPDTDPEDGKSG